MVAIVKLKFQRLWRALQIIVRRASTRRAPAHNRRLSLEALLIHEL
jgi:hypothetical protein